MNIPGVNSSEREDEGTPGAHARRAKRLDENTQGRGRTDFGAGTASDTFFHIGPDHFHADPFLFRISILPFFWQCSSLPQIDSPCRGAFFLRSPLSYFFLTTGI
jgi:hypothetical protein